MLNMHRITALLRLVIIALFALLVMLETLSLPGSFLSHPHSTTSALVVDLLLTSVAISWAISLQVALVMAWRMLTLARTDRIFTDAALRPMHVIVRVSGSVVITVALTFVAIATTADDPGAPVMLLLLLLCVTTAWLVAFVLRDVLRRAIAHLTVYSE